MFRILILILPLLAFIGGAVAGDVLAPEAEVIEPGDGAPTPPADDPVNPAWLSFENQFFVPIMRNGDMRSLVIMTLSLETSQENLPGLEAQEHRLRDAILRQLMIEANSGTFSDNYTQDANMAALRQALLDAVRAAGGEQVSSVLIEDVARQDQ